MAEVSLAALRHNCREAVRLAGPAAGVLAVVKADAYGHGAVAAARAFLEAGAWGLGVSAVAEGVELRRAGLTAPVVVLGGAFPGEEAAVVAHDLEVGVWSLERAQALAAAARTAGRELGVHVKLNTGMTRLGIEVGDACAVAGTLRELPGLSLRGVFSHLASADAVDTAAARTQIARFAGAVEALRAAGLVPPLVHLANSAATLCAPEAHFGLVRPGIMLYGYAPASHLARHATLRPAMRFRTRVAQLRRIPPHTPVGYGGTWSADRPAVIATLPLGYADGYHRLASNRAAMLVHGCRVPVAGRVCMDHTMLDVSDVPDVAVGDLVVAFGPHRGQVLGADEVGEWTGTISYEVLTSVGKRVPRAYVEEFSDG